MDRFAKLDVLHACVLPQGGLQESMFLIITFAGQTHILQCVPIFEFLSQTHMKSKLGEAALKSDHGRCGVSQSAASACGAWST